MLQNTDQINVITPWLIEKEGYNITIQIEKKGFLGLLVGVKYYTAECKNSIQCKNHSSDTFATSGDDYQSVSGILWFQNLVELNTIFFCLIKNVMFVQCINPYIPVTFPLCVFVCLFVCLGK